LPYDDFIPEPVGGEYERIGVLCPYTAEELIDAAGFVPVRPTPPDRNLHFADGYLPNTLCSWIRYVLDLVLGGDMADYRALIINHSCDASRRLRDIVKDRAPFPIHFVDTPRKRDTLSVGYLHGQLLRMREFLQDLSGRPVTDDDLRDSIAVYRENRRLLGRLYESRAAGKVSSPRDVARLFEINCSHPKRFMNSLLQRVIDGDDGGSDSSRYGRKRIFLSGNVYDVSPVLDIIEQAGGVVIGDDLCFMGRYFRVPAPEEDAGPSPGDPLRELAETALHRLPCGRMADSRERLDGIVDEIRRNGARGVIYTSLKFCDNFVVDYPALRRRLEGMNVPSLLIEGEYHTMATGQIRTRVEAFLETL
jgi:benzoyl-CoA reductase subunit C